MAKTPASIKRPEKKHQSRTVLRQLQQQGVIDAVRACEEKKASDISLLKLEEGTGPFTDYFVICSGSNPRQIQAISDEVEERLAKAGLQPTHVEGYNQAEWVLLDYVDFVVHVFSEAARKFYDLERLWKSAERLDLAAVAQSVAAATRTKAARKRTARASGDAEPAKRKSTRAATKKSRTPRGRK